MCVRRPLTKCKREVVTYCAKPESADQPITSSGFSTEKLGWRHCSVSRHQFAIETEAPPADSSLLHRLDQRTARLMHVPAVRESAPFDIRTEFFKPPRQFLAIELVQAKFLQTGRIDDAAMFVEFVQPGMCSGMPSSIKRDGNPGSSAPCLWNKRIDERRFSHPGLTYQNAEMALQIRQQGADISPGAQFHQTIAKFPIKRKHSPRRVRLMNKIGLVE